ncbi:TPA: hypothetical protein U2J46_003011 [Providencia stuartii]|uniref:hypothetical protein n=1 Tax=Providencia stuartii TaxID=588 RepID=UPI000909A72B|nr:hypothetical protein [Providencia stuartii]APG52626.1 hypothetical protein BGK56_17450 [Providencia stuartii]MTC67757.1 hypothetical protein [Providencia stuartii]SPY68513.1 Uncharacterised protein [Providencia stuartii]SUC43420.1 Uncharacterised protein [Providencia stuartii]HEM7518650.1 hypothetical protein [Providencia stuartii]
MSIKPELVERDSMGYWVHSQIPETEDSNVFEEWITKNELDYTLTHMDCDLGCDDSIYKSYFEDGDINISNWEPSKPEGRGWFVGGIYETEDSPVCMWLRQTKDKERDEHLDRVKDAILIAQHEAFVYAIKYKHDGDASDIYAELGKVYMLRG